MHAITDQNAIYLADTRRTLSAIDREYSILGCLGVGGFGSVFLARKGSGRKVALKVMPMDTSDDDEYETFTRELESGELSCVHRNIQCATD
jgi:serine/threonine protein kinase